MAVQSESRQHIPGTWEVQIDIMNGMVMEHTERMIFVPESFLDEEIVEGADLATMLLRGERVIGLMCHTRIH